MAFIDGRDADGGGEPRTIVDAASGEPLAGVADCEPADVDRAVRAAAAAAPAAAPAWAALTPGERGRVLLRLADRLEAQADDLARLETEETGKTLATMREGEVPFGLDNLRFFAGAARSLEGTGAGVLSRGYTSLLVRRPLGVVGAIVPWNFPFLMAIWKAGAALAAGNAMVLKPASRTPRGSLLLARLACEAGVPPGVLNVVTGSTAVGRAIVEHPGIAMVSVTGSTSTGRDAMVRAAASVKRVSRELGGKAPALVLDDADVGAMARPVSMGATYNSG